MIHNLENTNTNPIKDNERLTKVVFVVGCIIFFMLVGVAVGMFVVDKDCDATNQNAFNEGTQIGISHAIITLIQLSQNCSTIPILYENISINLIDKECLK